MSARRCRALALLVATLAPRAAGEEATLASLTGLFQREPERAAALVASAREGARAINQSRHSEGHETYFRQRRRIEAAVAAVLHRARKYITASLFPIRSTPRYHGARRRARKPQWLGM